MKENQTQPVSTKTLVIICFASLAAIAIFGLGIYALVQGVIQGRFIYFAQSFGGLFLGGLAIRVLILFWIAYFRSKY